MITEVGILPLKRRVVLGTRPARGDPDDKFYEVLEILEAASGYKWKFLAPLYRQKNNCNYLILIGNWDSVAQHDGYFRTPESQVILELLRHDVMTQEELDKNADARYKMDGNMATSDSLDRYAWKGAHFLENEWAKSAMRFWHVEDDLIVTSSKRKSAFDSRCILFLRIVSSVEGMKTKLDFLLPKLEKLGVENWELCGGHRMGKLNGLSEINILVGFPYGGSPPELPFKGIDFYGHYHFLSGWGEQIHPEGTPTEEKASKTQTKMDGKEQFPEYMDPFIEDLKELTLTEQYHKPADVVAPAYWKKLRAQKTTVAPRSIDVTRKLDGTANVKFSRSSVGEQAVEQDRDQVKKVDAKNLDTRDSNGAGDGEAIASPEMERQVKQDKDAEDLEGYNINEICKPGASTAVASPEGKEPVSIIENPDSTEEQPISEEPSMSDVYVRGYAREPAYDRPVPAWVPLNNFEKKWASGSLSFSYSI